MPCSFHLPKCCVLSTRILLTSCFSLLVIAFLSCKTREFNRAEVKATENIQSITRDKNGTYTVVCRDGKTVRKVTVAQIDSQEVCSDSNATLATSINPMAFNAFNIWQSGDNSEILEYPKQWDGRHPNKQPDNVFLVDANYYETDSRFTLVPTEGARVINDTLVYPQKDGRQLRLQFYPLPLEVSLNYASQICANKGWRLATARELFDFCASGVQGLNYGSNYNRYMGHYPESARCSQYKKMKSSNKYMRGSFWSVTWQKMDKNDIELYEMVGRNDEKGHVLVFSGATGTLTPGSTLTPDSISVTNFAFCVGAETR